MRLKLIGILSLFVLFSCTSKNNKTQQTDIVSENQMMYSTWSHIHDYQGFDLIEIFPNSKENSSFKFLLVPDSIVTPPEIDCNIIRIPVKTIVCFSSTQLSMIQDDCDKKKVVGIIESNYVQNPFFRTRIDSNLIADVGIESNYNVEKIISLNPDITLYSSYPNFNLEPLKATNSVLFPWADYLEQHPLGRAEWLRIMGRLVGKGKSYDSVFFAIRDRYNSLSLNECNQPSVFSDIAYAGQWYVPGGNSYIAKLFEDAGANYVFKDDPSNGSTHKSIETIIARASNADYWRITNSSKNVLTYDKLLKENTLYGQFKAFKEGNILVCDIFKTAYFETSIIHPDLILADFIYYFHPEKLTNEWSNYTPTYYKKLSR